jgi:ATP/maltotriose-dependent transcriptional regulator MalT
MSDTPINLLLEQSLETGEIGVCVKDVQRKVLMQNERCREICGDIRGRACEQGCMELLAQDRSQQWKNWGTRVYKNSLINGSFNDVTLLCSKQRIITFLQPLKDKYEKALAYYREKGLTQRESEVIALTIQGKSNSDICENLSISRATLRTHLNNIYRKFRDLGETPEFIPANRISG